MIEPSVSGAHALSPGNALIALVDVFYQVLSHSGIYLVSGRYAIGGYRSDSLDFVHVSILEVI